jgi:hypothetical protein
MTPQPNTPKDLSAFIENLKNDPAFFNDIGPAMALLKPGNWNGLVELARHHGYVFQAADFTRYINETLLNRPPAMQANTYLNAWLDAAPLLDNLPEPSGK